MTNYQIGDKVTVVTRRDISPGYQVVQSCHALADFAIEHRQIFEAWQKGSNYLACLAAKNEEQLWHLAAKLDHYGIKYTLFKEPDIENELTAIAVEPISDALHKKVLKKYQLTLR